MKTLWVQSLVERRLLSVKKQQGDKNVADTGTKATPPPKFVFLRELMGFRKIGDRGHVNELKTVASVSRVDDDEVLGLMRNFLEMLAAVCRRRVK